MTGVGARAFAVVCLLAFRSIPAAGAADECYLRQGAGALLFGNSRIEIEIDAASGAVVGMRNKAVNAAYLGAGTPGSFRLVYSTFAQHGAEKGDPWSAAYGTLVDGSRQHLSSTAFHTTEKGARLDVSYGRIQLERRSLDVGVVYAIELTAGSEESSWTIEVANRDEGTVREVHFPVLSGLSRLPALAMPNHAGQLLRDPVEQLSEETPEVRLEYPARASMQWFDYYSTRHGLYLASYDRDLNYTSLHFGRTSAQASTVAMWIARLPFTVSATTWKSPPIGVGLHPGDWHWGADAYRRWLESWVPPARVSSRVAEMVDSDPDIVFKDDGETLVHTYEDAVPAALRRPPGAGLMFVGWLRNGHDTYYPEYVPIPDLGGAPALTGAIDRIHAAGRLASAYVNLRLAAGSSSTYRNSRGWGVMIKTPGIGVATISSGELHEDWNRKWGPAQRGEGFHVVMCPSGRPWQDHMVAETSRALREYHFDGLFLDQPGSFYAELCYDKRHGHPNPASAWGPGYVAMLRRIREETRAIDPLSYLWIEGMNDVYAQFLDYALDKNPLWAPMRTHPRAETFPEMWRYTRPASIIVNDPKTYSYPPSQDDVYGDSYFYVMGIRGYGMLDDLDRTSESQRAARRAVLDKIARLWRSGAEYFFRGEFRDDVGLVAEPATTFARLHRGASGLAVAVWNTKDAALETELTVDLRRAGLAGGPSSVASLDTGRVLPYEATAHGGVRVRVRLGAHDIDAVVIHSAKATARPERP